MSEFPKIYCDNEDCNIELKTVPEMRNGLCDRCFSEFYEGVEPEDKD